MGWRCGDCPVTRVAFIDDDSATFKAEGAELDEAEPARSEALVYTSKATMLARLSREQFNQPQTAEQIASSVSRALVRKADAALLAQAEPSPVNAPWQVCSTPRARSTLGRSPTASTG